MSDGMPTYWAMTLGSFISRLRRRAVVRKARVGLGVGQWAHSNEARGRAVVSRPSEATRLFGRVQ